MSRLNLRAATPEDCAELALTMRQADRTELLVGGSPSPYDSLMRGIVRSDEAVTIVGASGEVLAIGGCVQLAPRMGCPWLLASDGLMAAKRDFLRDCRPQLQRLNAAYPTLYNEVWEGNTVHIRWLQWLGFTVADQPGARPHFLPFWRTNNHV